MLQNINSEDQINFKGNVMTLQKFADTYIEGDLEGAADVLEVLLRKGSAKLVNNQPTKQEKAIETATREEVVRQLAEQIDAQEEMAKDNKAQVKREGRLTYDEVEIQYPNLFRAQEAELNYKEKLRISNTEIRLRDNVAYLVVRDITDAELNYINRTYTADNVIKAGMGYVGRGADTMVDTIDYTAKKVVTPVLEIGARASMGLLKALASTAVKTGATVINAGTKGARQTAYEIKHDPDIIRAHRELIETKDDVVRSLANKTGNTASGIKVIK
jgi:hypothetical protein